MRMSFLVVVVVATFLDCLNVVNDGGGDTVGLGGRRNLRDPEEDEEKDDECGGGGGGFFAMIC